jgi:hydroxypyruvate reductase
VIEAGHPVPDGNSERAARRFLELAASAGADDLVLVLLSGGASPLLAAPQPPLTLADKVALTDALLASGADISEINLVRRHLSRIKGGRLAAAAHPAQVVTLAISDVVGDRPSDIGSGPTVPDDSRVEEARAVLGRYGIPDPGGWSESVGSGDPKLARSDLRIVASGERALDAASLRLEQAGYSVRCLDAGATGEAREVAARHAREALEAACSSRRLALVSGGELTVTIGAVAGGRGGPNQEYALALAQWLSRRHDICALAADTDGVDGNGEVAGAYVDGESLDRLAQAGMNAGEALDRHDSGRALEAIGALFVPGPTRTNVNDLRMILVN